MQYARLEVRPELVDPAEAAGLAGARQEAFGSNGAPLPGAVLPDVPPQHLVLLRRPRPLPHRRLLAAATKATARLHPRPATAGRHDHASAQWWWGSRSLPLLAVPSSLPLLAAFEWARRLKADATSAHSPDGLGSSGQRFPAWARRPALLPPVGS